MASSLLPMHPKNPEKRKLQMCVDHLKQEGVLAFPSETGYVLLSSLGSKKAVDALRQCRQVDKHHLFSLAGLDVAQLSEYVHLTTPVFRLIKKHTPEAITFIVEASKAVPKMLVHPKRRTLGVRIVSHMPFRALLTLFGAPLICVGLLKKTQADEYFEPINGSDVIEMVSHPKLLVVETEPCVHAQTTIVDCMGSYPVLVREGVGAITL